MSGKMWMVERVLLFWLYYIILAINAHNSFCLFSHNANVIHFWNLLWLLNVRVTWSNDEISNLFIFSETISESYVQKISYFFGQIILHYWTLFYVIHFGHCFTSFHHYIIYNLSSGNKSTSMRNSFFTIFKGKFEKQTEEIKKVTSKFLVEW